MSKSTTTVFSLITCLVNDRIKNDKFFHKRRFTEQEVIENLNIASLDTEEVARLANVLVEECEVFNMVENDEYENGISKDDSLKDLIEKGYISTELNIKDGNDNGGDDFESKGVPKNKFKELFSNKNRNNQQKIQSHFKNHGGGGDNRQHLLFINFHIDKIASDNLTQIPELFITEKVCKSVFYGMELKSETKSMPLRPSRRFEYVVDAKSSSLTAHTSSTADIWCQIRMKMFNESISESVVDFAKNTLFVDELEKGDNVSVFFTIKDSVIDNNEWGSCPLLHVGTNFKTGDFSNVFFDKINSSFTYRENIHSFVKNNEKHADKESEMCGVYSQKSITLEIPEKMNEIDDVIYLAILEADSLFGNDDDDDDEEEANKKEKISDKLVINMAFAHPKARMRFLIMTYVNCFFNKIISTFSSSEIDNFNRELHIGRDTNMSIPKERSTHRVSRKVCLANDVCFACDNYRCETCEGLNHEQSLPYNIDNISKSSAFIKKMINNLESKECSSKKYTMKPCERASACHNFLCRGVKIAEPVSYKVTPSDFFFDKEGSCGDCRSSYSSAVDQLHKNKRTSLLLYGKVKDVVNSTAENLPVWRFKNDSNVDASLRKRVFYNAKDNLNNQNVIERLSNTTFRDILFRQVDVKKATTYFKRCGSVPEIDVLYAELEKAFSSIAKVSSSDKKHVEESKIVVDFVCKYTSSPYVLPSIYDNEKNVENAYKILYVLLRFIDNRNHAALYTLINKSMLKESTLVLMGTRCSITDISDIKNVAVRQFIVASKSMKVAMVNDEDLQKITIKRGSVSATTAPNDKISDNACHTWRWRNKHNQINNHHRQSISSSFLINNKHSNSYFNSDNNNRGVDGGGFTWRL